MIDCRTIARTIVVLFAVTLWQNSTLAQTQTPRSVVSKWIELHQARERGTASALTTGSSAHRAVHLLSTKRDDVRVQWSLGNQKAAAVVTNSLKETKQGSQLLLFWLLKRDGVWKINKSDVVLSLIVDERLRGFIEAGDVSWHVQRSDLLGHWEAAACTPPGEEMITACASELVLSDDNQFRLTFWGPGGHAPDYDMQGTWKLDADHILLTNQDKTHQSRVVWLKSNQLVLETHNGAGRADYERVNKVVAPPGSG